MRASLPIATTAALSIAVLIAAAGMEIGARVGGTNAASVTESAVAAPSVAIEDANKNGTPDWEDDLAAMLPAASTTASTSTTETDPLASMAGHVAQQLFGGYLSLKQYDAYSPERGEALGKTIAENLSAPSLLTPFTEKDLSISADTSASAISRYRAAMKDALAPLVTDDEPEITIIGRYVATHDASALTELAASSKRYSLAVKNVVAVQAPQSAAPLHVRTLNALQSYGETVDRLSKFSSDSLALFALLKTLDQNEAEMVASFDALARYYVQNIAQK